jgi:hypothetical protein
VSPEFVERIEDDPNRLIEFVVRKSGLAERAVEIIAFTRNNSLTGTYWGFFLQALLAVQYYTHLAGKYCLYVYYYGCFMHSMAVKVKFTEMFKPQIELDWLLCNKRSLYYS